MFDDNEEEVFMGVCYKIAKHLEISPTTVRLIVFGLFCIEPSVLFIYFMFALLS